MFDEIRRNYSFKVIMILNILIPFTFVFNKKNFLITFEKEVKISL